MIRLLKRKTTGVAAQLFDSNTPLDMKITGNQMLVASNIYDLMESKGWTPAQFAEKFSMTEDEILDWLGGQTDFDVNTLTKISFVLDVDVQALFAPIKSPVPSTKAKEELEFA